VKVETKGKPAWASATVDSFLCSGPHTDDATMLGKDSHDFAFTITAAWTIRKLSYKPNKNKFDLIFGGVA